jgi:hypothetical protein
LAPFKVLVHLHESELSSVAGISFFSGLLLLYHPMPDLMLSRVLLFYRPLPYTTH